MIPFQGKKFFLSIAFSYTILMPYFKDTVMFLLWIIYNLIFFHKEIILKISVS